MTRREQPPLSDDERDAIVLAVKSAYTKLKNLYQEITPIIQKYGFTVPSAGVIARDLSERIETSIVQHCSSFSKGEHALRPTALRARMGSEDLQGFRSDDQSIESYTVGFQQEGTLDSQNLSPLTCPLA